MTDTAERRSIAERRADATREAIVEAAWDLSRARGLTAWSLRDLAREVGLKAPTIYAYFDSKHAIYDAMFQEGYEELDRSAARWAARAGGARSRLKTALREFVAFCTVDPVRYQLMFQRIVSDFEPSPLAYEASLRQYDRFREQMSDLGVVDEAELDLFTAMTTGLTDQQIANDPGGDRWVRLVDAAVDMFCDHVGIPEEGDRP